MTTQITKFAMFAIAAFALGGMMVVPAFATHTELIHNSLGAVTGETESKMVIETDQCGHSSSVVLISEVTEDGSNDEHYINWAFNGCSSYDSISIKSYVNGVLQNVEEDVNASGSITFDSNFVGGNIVRATMVIYW